MKDLSKKEYDRRNNYDKKYTEKKDGIKFQKKKNPYNRKSKYKNIEDYT